MASSERVTAEVDRRVIEAIDQSTRGRSTEFGDRLKRIFKWLGRDARPLQPLPPEPDADGGLESIAATSDGAGVPPYDFPDEPEPELALESTREDVDPGPPEKVSVARLEKLPFSCICRLEVGYDRGQYVATGFVTRQGLIGTAAHVLLHPKEGVARRITVRPAHPRPGLEALQRHATDLYWCADWGRTADSFRPKFDYAALRINDPAALLGACHGLDWQMPASFEAGRMIFVSGYPADMRGEQWTHRGWVHSRPDPLAFWHRLATREGHSGSPVFTINAQNGVEVLGVHSAASGKNPGLNIARRVTAEMIADYERWAGAAAGSAHIS